MWVNNPDYLSKIRRGVKIWNTPKKLFLYEKDQSDYIVPYGFLTTLLAFLNEKDINYQVSDKTLLRPLKYNKINEFNLYGYQSEAVDKVVHQGSGILVSPAGSGKTRMAMDIIGRLGVKTLWLTHTLDLLNQSKRVFKEFYSNKVGEISGGKVNIQDITFATVQTMSKLDLTQYRDMFDLLIIDEVHKAVGTPTRVQQFYKVATNLNSKYKIGLTATLFEKKHDISMTPVYMLGEVIHEVPREKIKNIKAEHKLVELNTPPSNELVSEFGNGYLEPDRTINYHKQLEYLMNNVDRNFDILNNLIDNRNEYNIILTSRNEHLNIIATLLDNLGLKYEITIGKVKKQERERIQKEFSEGKINFLLSNYQLTSTGLDLPIANRLHLILPIRDKRTIIQSAGRIERLHELKKNAVVYDYVDVNIGNLKNMYNDRRRSLNAR